MQRQQKITIFFFLLWNLVLVSPSLAAEVGWVAQVEGGVDILRGGKLPAIPAKMNDIINSTDIIRTKSTSSAEIKFIDDSSITIAPGSRVAIEEYTYDAAKGQRSATLQMFMGMVHTVVKKIHQVKEPDFTIKTHTAIIGVRGTDWYTLGPPYVMPAVTDVYNGTGETEVRNSFAEVPGTVTLKGMAVSRVAANLPPTLPMPIEIQDLQILKNQLSPQPKGKAMCPPAGVNSCQPTDNKPAALISKGLTVTNDATTEAINTVTNLNQIANQNSMMQNLNSALYVPPMTTSTHATAAIAQAQVPSPVTPGIVTTPFNIQATWGPGAIDLDLHLTGPQGTSTFHIYYANTGSLTSQPYAKLNQDILGTSGSEVITVQQFNQGGTYLASVFNFGNQSTTSTNLSTAANAQVQVIRGGTVVNGITPSGSTGSIVSGGTVVSTVNPPSGQAGNTWQAVQLNPATGQVTNVNRIVNSSNSANVR